LQDAIIANNQINPVNNFEQYERNVLDIILNSYLYQSGSFTESQINTLETIASLCPRDAGLASTIARRYLYNLCGSNLKLHGYQGCYPEYISEDLGMPEERSNHHLVRNEKTVLTVYPNPTKDGIFVQFTDQHPVELTLTDYTGKVLYKKEIQPFDTNNFIPLSLQTGLFLCQVTASSGEIYISKFQVIK
jgi:hypothetical protein